MSTLDHTQNLLDSALSLNGRAQHFDRNTTLLGGVPELDSMAVVSLITSIESHFDIVIDDDDVSAETFETLGTLVDFIDSKLDR
ncbi:phosphopantetheine-binding protein [Thioalkalivibrio versutus]|uniref:phosphopantetheine-binding protein n=1 Tax=Thioalkalivibrio versutus TaxID=106634 RepID=UPI00036A9059|nr:phosphopantetheine-binding protein [Thioalkalivibrio versutus]OOC51300.1 acyl carrier protein [Thioalkalivibrio versutus]